MAFNENTRVKIPAILTFVRLGYTYISLKNHSWDVSCNIFPDIFTSAILRLNPGMKTTDIPSLMDEISLALDGEDLGKRFYQMLTSTTSPRLIDFDDFLNNSFHVVTELPCINGDEEFRPDITLLINGMPLAFIEVKKPNNKDGILAERDRINRRFKNKKFRRFINISQILAFSNNMEYDDDSTVPLMGAFYAATSYSKAFFNCFREETPDILRDNLLPEKEDVEDFILNDNNRPVIKHNAEFITNKNPATPTNRLILSLFNKARLAEILRYGIAYVKDERGYEKHIMRYPQFFASHAIQQKLDDGIKSGIIWHTQGSGKTALAYFNVHWLTDYFQKKNIVPKFYFIVDRLDLMDQAKREFSSRGLTVHIAKDRKAFAQSLKSVAVRHNQSGQQEMTVVNIQRFDETAQATESFDYDIQTQRVYFIDEAHRSYNPTGSFLANLINSDRNAIFISLTGTPLIGRELRSTSIWGDYIHKYYYNLSIADGYTLKLIREGIETKYKAHLQEALDQIQVLKGDLERKLIYSHEHFVEPMLEYIVDDLEKSRVIFGDFSIGGMVVCDSSEQAKKMSEIFDRKYKKPQVKKYSVCTSALILHDIGDKDTRKQLKEDFVEGKIDLLFVYNMLLTGFDAHRLKKLYIGRKIKDHNLLQTLTRVNRPYKEFRYGYVVDFADIRAEFDAANKAYWDELQEELGDEVNKYSDLFKTQEEITEELANIKEKLWSFDTQNAEEFSRQVSAIKDKDKVLELKKALERAKELYNLIRYSEFTELLEKLDFEKLKLLLGETERHLMMLNQKEALENNVDTSGLLNSALEDIYFMFHKVSENELKLADDLKDAMRKAREGLLDNFDQQDPKWVSLKEELERLFRKKNLEEITQEEMREHIIAFNQVYDAISELNRRNALLKAKYQQDEKYARVHKRIMEREEAKGGITKTESSIWTVLSEIKTHTDDQVLKNQAMLDNDPYFNKDVLPWVVRGFAKQQIQLTPETAQFINQCIVREYLQEYRGASSW